VNRRSHFPKAKKDRYEPEWIRVSDVPFSKAHTYRLIKAGKLKSALFDALQLGRGIRLISRRSLEQLLREEGCVE
jgi:hypothetical protein